MKKLSKLVTHEPSRKLRKKKRLKETREQRIKALSKLSKEDIVIMLVNTEFACDVLMAPTRKEARKIYDEYTKANT